VSYILTTRNRAAFLERTLTNIREYIDEADELIVIDGGSTDGTVELAHRNRDIVKQFVSEPDHGEGHAFNKALRLARGELIKPVTDDDYIEPLAMKRLVTMMLTQPEIDAIQCGGEMWEVEDGVYRFLEVRRLDMPVPSRLELFSVHHGLGMIFRISVVARIGGVSPSYASVDGDLLCKIIEAGCDVRYWDVNLYRWYRYGHSGVKKTEQMTRSFLMCQGRLGNWQAVFSNEPQTLVEFFGLEDLPRGRQLADGIFLLGRLGFGRLAPLLDLVSATVRLGRRLAATRRRWARRPASPVSPSLDEQRSSFTKRVTPGN
jgi:glycosyltransferase involved in cell wall biosynthesis